MERTRAYFDDRLQAFIAEYYPPTHDLNRATAYALSGTGKRVRPIFTLLSCAAVGGKEAPALQSALAVEMIHSYSLIHDDLPAMDNDSMRRGRPTLHIVFGDAIALLAGDALLTDSFEVLLRETTPNLDSSVKLRQASELALAAGSRGMVLGQCLDILWTDKPGADKVVLDTIHTKKTGCLIGAACAMGALAGGADAKLTEKFRQFGIAIGLAFQIYDDLLDDHERSGKSPGKDANANKLTYLKMMTAAEARAIAKKVTASAMELLAGQCHTTDLFKFSNALLLREN